MILRNRIDPDSLKKVISWKITRFQSIFFHQIVFTSLWTIRNRHAYLEEVISLVMYSMLSQTRVVDADTLLTYGHEARTNLPPN